MSSPELSALLWAAKEQPQDDLPRLALADWLEEHGEPDRAELIRAQCELARLPVCDPRRQALRARERWLLARHAARWLGGLRRFTHFSTFERGLIFLELSSADAFLHRKGQAERRAPEYLHVTGLKVPHGPGRRLLGRLAGQADAFSGLTHLQLRLGGPEEEFARLLPSPHLGLLCHLDLAGCGVGDGCARALASSPHLGRLRALGLAQNRLTDEGVRALARSPHLRGLTTLTLSGNLINDHRAARLLAAELPALAALDLPRQEGAEARVRCFSLSMPPHADQRQRDRC